ncbi:unnamed protein product [Sphagnum tenellum]
MPIFGLMVFLTFLYDLGTSRHWDDDEVRPRPRRVAGKDSAWPYYVNPGRLEGKVASTPELGNIYLLSAYFDDRFAWSPTTQVRCQRQEQSRVENSGRPTGIYIISEHGCTLVVYVYFVCPVQQRAESARHPGHGVGGGGALRERQERHQRHSERNKETKVSMIDEHNNKIAEVRLI